MTDPDLAFIKKTRGHHRAQVTKKCSYVKSDFNSFSQTQVLEYRSSLKDLKAKLDVLNDKVASFLKSEESDSVVVEEFKSCDKYNDEVLQTLALLDSGTGTFAPSIPVHSSGNIRYPQLPLPHYSHSEGESLEKFLKDFEKAMQTVKVDSYIQFIYLKDQLSGQPLALVKSLSSTEQTYEEAKSLLQKAFGSDTMLKYETLQSLCELKLTYQTDPYEYIGRLRTIQNSFTALNISVDEVLQYFFWTSMNEGLKSQFTQITNKSKPSLQEIKDHIFDATERYIVVQKRYTEKKSSFKPKGSVHSKLAVRQKDGQQSSSPSEIPDGSATSLAANVKYEKSKSRDIKRCILCLKDGNNEVDHPIFKCLAYASPKSKVDKLESMNACGRCANNHKAKECKFSFSKKCFKCGKWHFSFLCVESVKDLSKPIATKPEETSTGAVCTDFEILHLNNGCEASILPTFTALLPSKVRIRGLKDSGSQLNFVETDFAKQNQLKVTKSGLALTVKGINSSKQLVTEVVELELNCGSGKYCIQAVCIPKINTKLVLPGLHRIVTDFVGKGYDLADQCLVGDNDEISNIKLILGTDSDHCMPLNTVLFGEPTPSTYLESPNGVMLSGNVDRLLRNLNFLADKSKTSESMNGCTGSDPNVSLSGCTRFYSSFKDEPLTPDVEANFSVIDDHGKLVQSELKKATDDILKEQCSKVLNYEPNSFSENLVENDKLVNFVLDSAARAEDGRLVLPLLWNPKVSHLLGKNQILSRLILKSNFKKYHKDGKSLFMIDKVFKEQERLGIIERVEDLPGFLEEHPNYSFLPHMPVFKTERETSKCRNVFLSNLSERDPSKPLTVSHNQAMLPGPCLNRKISTTILQLRFDRYMLAFDLQKAFLQIQLPESDQVKLLFYWYRDVPKEDFHMVVYKHVRLPFGLRPSPALLLLGLYKLLILDTELDSPEITSLKRQIYDLSYMDNCGITFNDPEKLRWAYQHLKGIFSAYKFDLQQFVTNNSSLQQEIDTNLEIPTETPTDVKLFGLKWNRRLDTLSVQKLCLDKQASTKREVLRSIASNFDIYNFAGPLLNRARLFMHELQGMKELGWDTKLPAEKSKDWANMVKQFNASPDISVNRFVGERGDQYKLIAFTDSSKLMYGCVIFILNLRTNEVSFLFAKNRIVNKQLESKSIPSLEFHAISLGTEVLVNLRKELSGPDCVNPIDVVGMELYTDSLVCLHWLNAHVNNFEKLRNLSTFVKNRLNTICKLCEEFPIKFGFCEGLKNPADAITRPLSYKLLMKSTYFNANEFLSNLSGTDMFEIMIPNPLTTEDEDVVTCENSNSCAAAAITQGMLQTHVFSPDKCSSFQKLVRVHKYVLKFMNNAKQCLKKADPLKYSHFECLNEEQLSSKARNFIISADQHVHFGEVFSYFSSSSKQAKDMPNIIGQLNVFPDKNGILRVKSKTARWKDLDNFSYAPILLHQYSTLTDLIVLDMHKKTSHSGVYSLLSELRKTFWIVHYFSTVKRILKKCINCRRFNRRTIKLNQSPYRDFRLTPPNIPYRYIFLDYLGPYYTFCNGLKTKVWLMCITCLWSRAINLKLCLDLTVPTFLRSLQLHVWEHGVPQKCFSDMGSQIVAGTNLISDFLGDPDTKQYLQEKGIKTIEFHQYYKGCNKLGSLVESCVKLVKRLIHGSIKNSVLNYLDFESLVCQTVHLVNRRPVAFRESLRDTNLDEEIPSPITPEILVRGHELVSLNLIPNLQPVDDSDPLWSPGRDSVTHIKDSYYKLRNARKFLVEIYNSEFLAQLVSQATNNKSRYKPVTHKTLQVGDIVLLKEPYLKPANYPMGIVKVLQVNSSKEVTGATVMKGNKERVHRHSSSLIPLLSVQEYCHSPLKIDVSDSEINTVNEKSVRPKRRAAAIRSDKKTVALLKNGSA